MSTGDARFFTRVSRPTHTHPIGSTLICPQGKVAELREELRNDKKDKNFTRKKIALKKIVANMTMSNNDMAALFPDVIQCMNIPALEIKKMYAVCPRHRRPPRTRRRLRLRQITG